MTFRILSLLVVLVAWTAPAAAIPSCPASAALVVYADNASADDVVTLELDGELRDPSLTCDGAGAPTYRATLFCRGSGFVRCGTIADLRPGAWIHRLVTRVGDSEPQRQARDGVVVAGAKASNVLTWAVFARAFVVDAAHEDALRATLATAAAFTEATGDRAFVGFERAAFPGAADPRVVELTRGVCAEDGRHAGLCLSGSDLVVDALDDRADPGAVVLSIGSRNAPTIRVHGERNVLRGLVVQGSTAPHLSAQADALAITGPRAQGNRLERLVVRGPTYGDGVSVEDGAGAEIETVIVESEIAGAAGVGVKATSAARARVVRSCLHDNRSGGAMATLGGALVARENVVQRNAPGAAPAGLAVGASDASGRRSVLATSANVVRFNGARGLSVTDGADGEFHDDAVSDNQFAGARVETVVAGEAPRARLGGVALTCNYAAAISGTCEPSVGPAAVPCLTDRDCCGGAAGCCADEPGCVTPARCRMRASQGYGVVLASCAGCASPDVDLGGVGGAGHNAFALNRNDYPNGSGVNVLNGVPGLALAAAGNQWERCGVSASCAVDAVSAGDVRAVETASVDLGAATAARAGGPVVTRVSRGRPRAGEVVYVFGRGFNAIDGASCAKTAAPVDVCSVEHPRIERQNRSRYGNLVRLLTGGEAIAVDVAAVTPTMLAFRMPFDCCASAELVVSRRDAADVRRASSIAFCDVGGCADAPPGDPCDDGSVCTVEDSCDAGGRCLSGPTLDCGGPCMRCDPVAGCVPETSDTPCDDGDACTVGDHCRGDGAVCVSGAPALCTGACQTGVCDPGAGCLPAPAARACDDGNACTTSDHCRGDADVCVGGGALVCAGSCLVGTCDPARGCRPKNAASVCSDGDACTVRDHCRGDADVCLSGTPASCDDGDACTDDACDAPFGCRYTPRLGWDAVTCRLERVRVRVVESEGISPSARRGMVRLLGRALERTVLARAAETRGDARPLRRHLRALHGTVRRLIAAVDRGRGLPVALTPALRHVLAEALREIDALRDPARAGE